MVRDGISEKRRMKRRTDLSWAGRSASWAAVKYVALDNTRLLLIYEHVGFTINYILLCMQITQWRRDLLHLSAPPKCFYQERKKKAVIVRAAQHPRGLWLYWMFLYLCMYSVCS